MLYPTRISLSREELYEKVWSIPMSKLCKEFALSDRGLAKVCIRHDIPIPGRSYWRKKSLGQSPPRLPLAKLEEQFPIELSTPKPKSDLQLPEIPLIKVPAKLSNPHPLVLATRDGIESKFKIMDRPNRKILGGLLEISVYKGSTSRALRILDAIIKEIEARGGSVEARDGTYLSIKGQSFKIHVHELTKRVEHIPSSNDKPNHYYPRYNFIPTGSLVFTIDAQHDGLTNIFKDDKSKLEDQIGEIIRNLDVFADIYKQRAIERRKAEILSREREQQRYDDQQRVKRLEEEIQRWEKTRKIKSYLRAILREHPSSKDSKTVEWTDWIKRYIARRESAHLQTNPWG